MLKLCVDVVPTVPGRFMGFEHPHGEVHILSPGNAVSCPGMFSPTIITRYHKITCDTIGDDDATDPECQNQWVPNVLDGNILDHVSALSDTDGTIFLMQI